MELLTLGNLRPNKGARKKKKRVGRGIGSGHGKTSTRGQKGQHARNHVVAGFEGGQTPLHRRLPKLRGKGKGAMNIGSTRKHYGIVNLQQLNRIAAGSVVTAKSLRDSGIVKGRWDGLRVLGEGKLTVALTVQAQHFSASAREAIEAAGGTAEIVERIIGSETSEEA
ncbi:MAG TPA: 50S ribosomal protein L15 [Abditibacteriaceae bacterium]|jgi:large subunit ribosomal protein L15